MSNNIKLNIPELLIKFQYCPSTGTITRRSTGREIGSTNTGGYRQATINGTIYLVHRLAWVFITGKLPDSYIDHINGNKLDNSMTNLREVSHAENMLNKQVYKNNSSGFKGVYYSKSKNRYEAQVRLNGIKYTYGGFLTAEEASIAYEQKSAALFKEFKRTVKNE